MSTVTKPDAFLSWTDARWAREAHAWIRDELAAHGADVTGGIEQVHARPWSTVLRVPTSHGTAFMKASAPVFAHEAPLTAALSAWHADAVPDVLAVHAARGWTLARDAGVTLRAAESGDALLARWEAVLPRYAELQRACAARAAAILAIGTPDRRLAHLPALLDALLDDEAALMIGHEDGLTREAHLEARRAVPAFAAACEAIAAFGVPETLHHDDFHDGNVFESGGRVVFADWAESAVTHPFCTLTVAMRGIAYRAGVPEDSPRLARLIDAYLEAWTAYGSLERLRDAAALAVRAGRVVRALTWHALVSSLSGDARRAEADAVPGWVQVFVDGELAARP